VAHHHRDPKQILVTCTEEFVTTDTLTDNDEEFITVDTFATNGEKLRKNNPISDCIIINIIKNRDCA
jgi:hypothetical protein